MLTESSQSPPEGSKQARDVRAIVAMLFGESPDGGHSLTFSWRLVRRGGRPFLLLPVSRTGARLGLSLYSAQRVFAKVCRALLPILLRTPAVSIFRRIDFQVDGQADLIRFLSEQTGVAEDHLDAPAIRFGILHGHGSRLVLLACDGEGNPRKVVKCGMDPVARAAIEREADILERIPAGTPGCILLTGRLTTPRFSAFATDYVSGRSPESDTGMEDLFLSWINPGPPTAIEELDPWAALEASCSREMPVLWAALREKLAGKKIRGTLRHGDFTPWNVIVSKAHGFQVFDWELGSPRGLPAWDWFYFMVQTSILVKRHSPARIAVALENLLASPRFERLATATGIRGLERPLALAYVLHHCRVANPATGRESFEELLNLLARRWGFPHQD